MSETNKALVRRPKTKALDKAKRRKREWCTETMTAVQADEAEALKSVIEARPHRPSLKAETIGGALTTTVGDGAKGDIDVLNSIRLYHALGSRSDQFTHETLTRICEALSLTDGANERNAGKIASAVAMVAAIGPTDELEATMAQQMVAANESALTFFRRAARTDYIEHASAYSNMANKAMRSFALHAEALAKLRRGGEQVVKHVHVNEGGQAVIANTVTTGGAVK